MYKYLEDKDLYCFACDLKEYLLAKGVSKEHIERMKNKTMEPDRYEYHITPPIGSAGREYEALVPIDSIIGTNRATVGDSVFDNVNQMHSGEREPYRFTKCFNYLNEMTLDELKQSYENMETSGEPVRMMHYLEDDTYYVTNGNHRALTAMLLGAPTMRAKVIDAKCDENTKRKYIYEENFKSEYKIEDIYEWGLYYAIAFVEGERNYYVTGFPPISASESMYEYIDKLKAIIDEDRIIANRIRKLPLSLRAFILKFFGKDCSRINQYIDKTYADESCYIGQRLDNTITLYDV